MAPTWSKAPPALLLVVRGSPYDGATWTAASDVDIDHLVPLSNAWKSGAASWTTARRRAFANDLTNPQLLAVTDDVNESKGDSGPEDWKPPLTLYYCTYAKMWVKVKSVYSLTITSAKACGLVCLGWILFIYVPKSDDE